MKRLKLVSCFFAFSIAASIGHIKTDAQLEKLTNLPLFGVEHGFDGPVEPSRYKIHRTSQGKMLLLLVVHTNLTQFDGIPQLWIANLHPWHPTKLYAANHKNISTAVCSVSPSGNKVLFGTSQDMGPRKPTIEKIYLVHSDGSRLRDLTPHLGRGGNYAWITDNLFWHQPFRSSRDKPYEFSLVNLRPFDKRLVFTTTDQHIRPSVSKDKSRLRFSTWATVGEPRPRKFETAAVLNLSSLKLESFPKGARPVKHTTRLRGLRSPDGWKRAYIEHKRSGEEIWVADSAGRNPRLVHAEKGLDSSMVWSADGQYLYFTKAAVIDEKYYRDVYRLRVP